MFTKGRFLKENSNQRDYSLPSLINIKPSPQFTFPIYSSSTLPLLPNNDNPAFILSPSPSSSFVLIPIPVTSEKTNIGVDDLPHLYPTPSSPSLSSQSSISLLSADTHPNSCSSCHLLRPNSSHSPGCCSNSNSSCHSNSRQNSPSHSISFPRIQTSQFLHSSPLPVMIESKRMVDEIKPRWQKETEAYMIRVGGKKKKVKEKERSNNNLDRKENQDRKTEVREKGKEKKGSKRNKQKNEETIDRKKRGEVHQGEENGFVDEENNYNEKSPYPWIQALLNFKKKKECKISESSSTSSSPRAFSSDRLFHIEERDGEEEENERGEGWENGERGERGETRGKYWKGGDWKNEKTKVKDGEREEGDGEEDNFLYLPPLNDHPPLSSCLFS